MERGENQFQMKREVEELKFIIMKKSQELPGFGSRNVLPAFIWSQKCDNKLEIHVCSHRVSICVVCACLSL